MTLIARCIKDMTSVPDDFIEERAGWGRDADLRLTIGRDYVVYAITTSIGGLWFYVINDDNFDYPTWYPAALFDVGDGQLPAHWRLWQHIVATGRLRSIVSFPEWAADPNFYEKLYDSEPAAVEAFAREVERSAER